MRWPHESAIIRRDDSLARIRKLSAWIAGGATAASFGLAAALGFALPGHSYRSGTPVSHPGTGKHGGKGAPGQGNGGLAPQSQPPSQPPPGPVAPPVVTSGGS